MTKGKRIPAKFWNEDFIEALKASMGNVLMAAKMANVSAPSYYNYRYSNPAFAKKADQVIERICVPILEDIAFIRAMKGDNRLLIFLLRTRGGKKWNQDLVAAAAARYEAELDRKERDKHSAVEQGLPTYAEKMAAKAYLAALEEEERRDPS